RRDRGQCRRDPRAQRRRHRRLVAEARRRLVERGRSRAGEALHGPRAERVMTILVIGNATVDLSFEVDCLPRPGETLLARSRMIDAGGKGLNQAIVAHRAGAGVAYVAAIGEDLEGEIVSRRLLDEEMDIAHLLRRKGATDQSIIYLDSKGENSIVSTAAMAASLGTLDAEAPLSALGPGDLLLMQGNLSQETTHGCLARGRWQSARTLLNPAPIAFDY